MLALVSLAGTPALAKPVSSILTPMMPPADEPVNEVEEVDSPPGPALSPEREPIAAPRTTLSAPVLAHPPERQGWRPPPLGPAPQPPVHEPCADARPRHPHRAAHHQDNYQPEVHYLPGLSGSTGLVDIPVAYTLPRGRWMLSTQSEKVDGNANYWPTVYRAVKGNANRLHAGYGVASDTEMNLTVENWNHELHYFDPIFGVDPNFSAENKLFFGIGAKRAFQLTDRVWAGVGVRYQHYEEQDRAVTELHEYERFSHAFATASWQASDSLYVHAMFKYVVYDWDGDRPASGASGLFPGFSLPSTWSQPGIGVEYRFRRHWSAAGEFISDTDVQFLRDVGNNAVNATIRYEDRDKSFGIYAKRLNVDHLFYGGIQGGVSF